MLDSHAYATRSIEELYHWFAGEASPTSPAWGRVCTWVERTPELVALLDTLPGRKRQPNLFLAAVKYLEGPLQPGPRLTAWVAENWAVLEAVILGHATQTNEPGRCAVLAPVLASLPQPVTLLEVGASAGLLLVPDRYRYEFDGVQEAPAAAGTDAVVLGCRVGGRPPGAVGELRIRYRAGLDRNPLRADDPEVVRWLRALERHRGTSNFVVALDGEPLGFGSPHGSWVEWY